MMRALSLALLLGVAACASSPDAEPNTVTAEPSPASQPAGSVGTVPAFGLVPQSSLGPQSLDSKECGLFLWSQTDPTQLIYFQKASSGVARVRIGNATVDAPQVSNAGTIFGQFMTEQGFAAPTGELVDVVVVPGEELDGGQRIQAGQLSIKSVDGWKTLIPVLGVRACKP